MRSLTALGTDEALRITCIGAHCDDVEIGAGGTILELLAAHPGSQVRWLILTSTPERAAEAHASAAAFTADAAWCDLTVLDLRDGYLPARWAEVKDALAKLAADDPPDLVLTHSRDDAHQDHRLLAELTTTEFRDHLVLEYEIPKSDGDLGRPNCYVPLRAETVQRKAALLATHYPSQQGRRWFDPETFSSLARLRGIEAGGPIRYAEGFHLRKAVL
ncbi:PIG-L family deacetylase [Egibacter rhizosphaerae]|uniref:PIG-L family deacetylase n=1 Tax=Egibacter rhizosphaerae TaxID=1670831 RepID=A0A411YGT5_9ACTN|nr:PIG-L family deacetylase [Egibacter rhizosphaerae]QBI20292.1 PIG-L family deacetylase [Egibacter rhizosphaerae]